ncbi:uncharacterized protein [Musca autumnalis]|uniref:uncharacterized protein n=1 Tax=Musca autumnalis TaxID=221902 RepID=UPI003CF3BF58
MNKENENLARSKNATKKRHHSSSSGAKNIEGFLKKQYDTIAGLNDELKKINAEKQQIMCCITDKNKNIQELCKSIEQRDEQIKKLNEELTIARANNQNNLDNFHEFKEKFFKLEENYDQMRHIQNQEIELLKQQIEAQKSIENQQINELHAMCQKLNEQIQEKNQRLECLTADYAEILRNSDKYHKEYENLQKDFENYKNQVEMEKNTIEEDLKKKITLLEEEMDQKEKDSANEIAKLNSDVTEKDEMIRQCIKDKEFMEKEKNQRIEELTYKINKIEKVFGQPTKSVAPYNKNNISNIAYKTFDNEKPTTSKAAAIASNIAITKPQNRRESDSSNDVVITNPQNRRKSDSSNDEVITKPQNRRQSDSSDDSDFIRDSMPKKIPRPHHHSPVAGYLEENKTVINKNNAANVPATRKRGQGRSSNSSQASKKNAAFFSNENEENLLPGRWGAIGGQGGFYVPESETSASEGFFKSKRSKK